MNEVFSKILEKNREKIINIVLLGSIVVMVLFLLLPLLREGVVYGDDIPYHAARIDGLAKAIRENTLFSGIRTNYLDGYGYGTGFFYCDFFIILPAFFRCAGFTLDNCYKILQVFLVLAMAMTAWIGLKEITRNKIAATVGTILFIGSHYFMLNLFARSAIGETTAMIFLPLVVAGLYNLVRDGYSKPWFLVIGLAGTCLSHTISTVFYVVLCVIVFLIHLKKILKNKLFPKLVISALITLGITAFHWVSMLEQMFSQEYNFHHPWVKVYEQCTSFLGSLGDARYSIGYLLIILVVLVGLLAKKESLKRNLIFAICPMVGLVLLSVESFWKMAEGLLGFMQFPWRLLSLITFSFILFISNILSDLLNGSVSNKKIIVLFVALILFYVEMNHEYYEERIDDVMSIDMQSEGMNISMLGGGKEWLPIEVDIGNLTHKEDGVSCDNIVIPGKKEALTFTLVVSEEVEYIDVPFIYYKGYKGYNVTQNEQLKVSKSNEGLVRVTVSKDMIGDTVIVKYRDTPITWIGRLISVILLLVCMLIVVKTIRQDMVESE